MGETFDHEAAAQAQHEFVQRKGWPDFAPKDGQCWACHRNIYDLISVEKAGTSLVTGCPHCHRSYCD